MDTNQILNILVAERDRLNIAIDALSGPAQPVRAGAGRRGSAASPQASDAAAGGSAKDGRKKIVRTPAQRKAQAERMRAYWAAKRQA